MHKMSSRWKVIYKKARNPDGSLFFPEELSEEFLTQAQKTMGSYIFANQYLNEIIPDEMQTFKKEWFRYYKELPKRTKTFCMIDPAMSQDDGADYTAVVIVHVDIQAQWYVEVAKRVRITPTNLIKLVFEIYDRYTPHFIGIESVAFQQTLLYMVDEEMKKRGVVLPVYPVKPSPKLTKEGRIRNSLVPRMEWGRILFNQGLHDLEQELLQFPRGSHDDIVDALAYIDRLTRPPEREKNTNDRPNQNDRDYEKHFIQKLIKESSPQIKGRRKG